MKYRQNLVLWLFVPVIVASVTINSFASCPITMGGPPCQEYWSADAVFIGMVTRVVRVPNQTQLAVGPYLQSTVYLNVEEAFKGVQDSAVVFELDHCGYFFKEDERYLVYARLNRNTKQLEVRSGNSRTRLLSDAAEDLQYIRGLSSAEPGGRIVGKVGLYKHNIKASLYDGDPLANIKVTLEGNNQRQDTLTNSGGEYEFKNLSAGDYQVRAQLPEPFGVDEQTVKAPARGCVQVYMIAKSKGQITGRVLDSQGKPAVYVPVSLVSAEASLEQILSANKEKAEWAFVLTNEEGRYAFSFLPPGRYLVVINRAEFERSRGAEAARLLPRLFYPGVNDASGATVIVVDKDRKTEEYNFNLPLP